MNNISLNKEDIQLKVNTKYIIIDGLYIDEIKQGLKKLNINDLIEEIKVKVFPYLDIPFAEYIADDRIFQVSRIRKASDEEVDKKSDKSLFASDTGVLVFVNETLLLDFICAYNYEDLTDSSELINEKYWQSIARKYDFEDMALIVSPGLDSGVEFDGSGIYRIGN